jgi:hypothetical protein
MVARVTGEAARVWLTRGLGVCDDEAFTALTVDAAAAAADFTLCQVVLEVLLSAARQGKRFRVLVVDGRPELEGRQMMRRLLQVNWWQHVATHGIVGCTHWGQQQ